MGRVHYPVSTMERVEVVIVLWRSRRVDVDRLVSREGASSGLGPRGPRRSAIPTNFSPLEARSKVPALVGLEAAAAGTLWNVMCLYRSCHSEQLQASSAPPTEKPSCPEKMLDHAAGSDPPRM